MKGVVLDCSVTIAWCFGEESDDYSSPVISSLSERPAIVPALWAYEVSNVLIVAERHKRIRQSESAKLLEMILALPITVDMSPIRIRDVSNVARTFELSSYDASYLELAMRLGLSLATVDRSLRRAADGAGVELFVPAT